MNDLDLPDAPDIARAERTGLRPGEIPFDDEDAVCPVCGHLCDTIYQDTSGEIKGCDVCIKPIDAFEWALSRKEGN